MKKVAIFGICILCIIITVFGINYANLTKYKFSPKACQSFFSHAPEEAAEECNQSMTGTNKFCTFARVDKDGNLLLYLNDNQKQNWDIQQSTLIQSAHLSGTVISRSFTKITVKGYRENIDVRVDVAMWAIRACAIKQLISGTEPEAIQVEFSVIDAKTNEELYNAIWPNETILWNTGDSSVSSKNTVDG